MAKAKTKSKTRARLTMVWIPSKYSSKINPPD